MVLKAAIGARLCSVHVPMAQWSGASRHVPSLALVCVPGCSSRLHLQACGPDPLPCGSVLHGSLWLQRDRAEPLELGTAGVGSQPWLPEPLPNPHLSGSLTK